MRFEEASAVSPAGEGLWKAEVQPEWDIFGIANGGYLMAIGSRAMSASAEDRRPVSVTAHFLRPVTAGPVEVAVDELKRGRTFSTMGATLSADSDSITMLGGFVDPAMVGRDDLYVAASPPDLPPPEACPRALPNPDGPLPPPLLAHFEERIHPDDLGPFGGRPSRVARVRGWFRLHDQEPTDAFTLLLVADAFPPAVFNADLPLAWTPTLEMTTQVRAVPAPGWLRCQFTTRLVSGGLLEEDGEIWDETGRLVALSRQLALVPR
jgi:acyl-CoA thioesterase